MNVSFRINRRDIVRWLLGGILVWAAVSKLPNLQEFYGALAAYRLPLPAMVLRFTAAVLPWLELFCGLLLLAHLWYRAALLWFLILCLAFLIATGEAWLRGLDISCGCMNLDFLKLGGNWNHAAKLLESTPMAFGRALLLSLAGVYLLRNQAQEASPAKVG
jgi:putative oxidoreductase